MSKRQTNIESHPASILKKDVSENQMIDSNSRPEGQIKKKTRVGSAKAREMRPSEARLAEGLPGQPVTGVPLSLCRIMPPPGPTPRYNNKAKMDAEKKVTSYWDMLPTELHVVILKIHPQETMLFHTRGWMFMKTVCGWKRIER